VTRDAPNTLMLHQYALGELDEVEREQVRQAIEADPDVRRRYQAIQASEAGFAVQSLPPWLQEQGTARAPWWRRWLPVLAPGAGLVALAAAALLVVGLPGTAPTASVDGLGGDEIRVKGELPALEVWVGTEAGPRPIRPGEALSEGTTVNLLFDARGHRFATLAGQDGTGAVEIYDTLEVSGQQGLVHAPFGLQLDDAPGPQAFFVLVHDEPMPGPILQDHVRDGTGDLTRIVVDKE